MTKIFMVTISSIKLSDPSQQENKANDKTVQRKDDFFYCNATPQVPHPNCGTPPGTGSKTNFR